MRKGDDEVIATVNDMQITRGELNASWDTTFQALQNAGVRSTLQVAEARSRLIQQLVGARITLLMAQKVGAPIDDRAVEAKRDEIVVDRLRAVRHSVVGKTDAAEERLDPREDSAFKSELSKNGMSLSDVEKQQLSYVPEAEIQQALAQDGIRKALQRKAGTVTPDDIKNSYNVYSMRQIIIPKGSMPDAQLATRVNKIVSDAKGGADFAALAKQYSKDSSKGAVQNVSYGQVPSDAWNTISKMKSGEVSNPISTDQAVFIVKMENVTQKLPAKFDKKEQDNQRNKILNQRAMEAYLKIQQEMGHPTIERQRPGNEGLLGVRAGAAGNEPDPGEATVDHGCKGPEESLR